MTGAPGDEGGSLWVFTEPGFEMSPYSKQGSKIEPSDATPKPFFGNDVAMSADGNTIFAGASNDNSGIGAAWVFTRESFKWKQQGSKITAEGEVGPAAFGVSVALSADGNTAVIGSSEEDRPSEFLEEAGSAWQFTRSEGTWTQCGGKLTGSGDQHEGAPYGGQFGNDVALSADAETALIGGFQDHALVGAGAAWTFSTASGPCTKEEPKPIPPVEKPKGGGPVITAAQIAALLSAHLLPSGKAAKIAAILKHGGFAGKLSALQAGVATISWFKLPPGAKLAKKAKPKPILVASGSVRFGAAGTSTVKLKLTRAGKRLLKHSKRLKLTARGAFTPTGGATVTAKRSFVLKR